MKSALEEKLKIQVNERHPILSWIGPHANFMISRLIRVGADGRTPYERRRGRRWKRPSVSFGVWFKPLKSYVRGPYGSMRERLYLGAHGRNGDALITKQGMIKGGSPKRMPEAKRWSNQEFDQLVGTPWKMRPQGGENLDAPVRVELPEVP